MADPVLTPRKPAPVPAPAIPAPLKLVRLKLNGRETEAPVGTSILEAARKLGIHIPVFCYHPGLTVAGNCRMCLVEASNSKKPVIACATAVAEGLEVQTESDLARKARAGVLELMLLNHPLDCPICDKSGECLLQDHSYDHGKSQSRMVEEKVLKHTKPLGSTIWIWGNRCIVCTRCTRFCDEVAGTSELCVVERGDRSVVDVFPGQPLENPLAGNTVDICPVGALISKDFLYQARVWNVLKTPSICTGCARGCNIEIQHLENRIVRLVPRENRAVNDWWMCDYGRYDYKYVAGPKRVLNYRLGGRTGSGKVNGGVADPAQAGRHIAEGLRAIAHAAGPQAVAGIASTFMTLEELYLFWRLSLALGTSRRGAIARPAGREERFKGGFVISADKNPNRAGAERILGRGIFEEGYEEVCQGIERGEVRGLLLFANLPGMPLEARLVEALGRLEFAAVFLLEEDPRLPPSASIFPATAFAEKDGSMVNDRFRVQRLRPALALPRAVRPELEVLQEALLALGERRQIFSAGAVFRELGNESIPELEGRTHQDLGIEGLSLHELVPGGRGSLRGGA